MRLCVVLIAACLLSGSVRAADVPRPADFSDAPVTIVVAFAPGGLLDTTFRLVATYAAQELGQPVVVENITSGGNIQGNLQAINAAPDGHVWGTWGLGLVSDELLIKQVTYTHNDVTPVAMVSLNSHIICVGAQFAGRNNVATLRDLITVVAANPGKVVFGVGGNWTSHDSVRMKLQKAAGAEFVRMPFLGGSLAAREAADGNCDVVSPLGPEMLPYIDDARLLPLAVTGEHRITLLPDVPTVRESGYPELEHMLWVVVSVPKGTPQATVDYIASVLSKVMLKRELQDRLHYMGITPFLRTGGELSRFIEDEYRAFKAKTEEWGIGVDR